MIIDFHKELNENHKLSGTIIDRTFSEELRRKQLPSQISNTNDI